MAEKLFKKRWQKNAFILEGKLYKITETIAWVPRKIVLIQNRTEIECFFF